MTEAVIENVASQVFRAADRAGKYLSFILGDEEYGIEILTVREIMGIMEITIVPHVPHFVKGVINLRGSVIPVVDLRLKFSMPERGYDKETCIIVVNLHKRLMGIIVDTVSEVLNIDENEIDDSPNFGSSVETDFILGMGKVKEKVVILLDIDKVLTSEQITTVQSVTETVEKEEEDV